MAPTPSPSTHATHIQHLMNMYADYTAEEFDVEQENHAQQWCGYIEWSEWCPWRGGMPAYDWFTGETSPYFNGSSLDTRCKVCQEYDCRHEQQLMDWYRDYSAEEFNAEQEAVADEAGAGPLPRASYISPFTGEIV